MLPDGESVRGKLETRGEEHLVLLVRRPESTRSTNERETIRYEEVQDADLPAPPIGRRLEIGLASGEKDRGRLLALTDRAMVLEVEPELPRECPYAEVTSVRTAGMSKGVKIAIGAGVVAAVLAVLGYFVVAPGTGA